MPFGMYHLMFIPVRLSESLAGTGPGNQPFLKILSGITYPSSGEIELNGRVGSLLEVGTGFHPELTGRENIYFNGSILGMTRREIDDKFDEIVKFAGIGRVFRYTSEAILKWDGSTAWICGGSPSGSGKSWL